jgi:ribonuclease BN (tRNA processing enzyme)
MSHSLGGRTACVFNDEVWPDFVALSERIPPFLRLQTLRAEDSVEAEGLTITPVPVHHVVPTFGFIVRGDHGSVIFAGDSGPTTRLWELAAGVPDLRAVFLEASFPNRMRPLAEASLHLTSTMVGQEAEKLPAGVRIIAVHLKVAYRAEIERELEALRLPDLEVGECDKEYLFP